LVAALTLLAAGCRQLQPGFYLTPDNFPTPVGGGIQVAESTSQSVAPAQPTSTPVSTVRAVETPTLTAPPTQTPAASATPTEPSCAETEGRIVVNSFTSSITGSEFRYRVYLPPCYESSGKRYPSLYMLHGLGAGMDDSQWDRMGLGEAASAGFVDGSLPPMIIVMPNGNDAAHDQHGPSAPYPELIVNELIPLIDSQYCTWADPTMRAIGGLSRGGFWAYWIALSHSELFSRVGGHSAYLYEPDFASDKNPNNIALSAEGIESLSMYFDRGGEGRELSEIRPGIEQFMALLAQRGITPIYVENATGDHVESYWSAHLSEYLTFYGENWPRDVGLLPSCGEPSPAIDG
jgi:enterochelin esterase-like enzyme